jgi:hypothetical protein
MTPTRKYLLDLIENPDQAFNMKAEELYPLRLTAVQELFAERIEQIPLLKHRAEEAGIRQIEKFDDLVPLLFAHTVYKSYPESLVQKGKWDRLLKWLDSLSVPDVTQVDMTGVSNIDAWLDRLWAADFRVMATSGSSGKCSFMTHTAGDQDLKRRHFKYSVAWPYQIASKDRPVFWTGQIEGPNSAVEAGQFAMKDWAREGEMHVLAKEPLRISEVSKMAAMRKRIGDGTAAPEEIAAFEAEAAAKAASGKQELLDFADKVLDHRHEPIYLIGFWAQHLAIVNRARERGIGDGEFHPDSIIGAGGGVKGIALPDGYKDTVDNFYGNVKRPNVYAMTELTQAMPRCEANNYHIAPGLIVLLLDESGEKLLNPSDGYQGEIEGRFGFVDLAYEGRWGGLITGDKVVMDFSGQCACGRTGPVIKDNIMRYAQAGGEDKISCAGTIDAYVKGQVGEPM